MLSPQENMLAEGAKAVARAEELSRRLFRTRNEIELMAQHSPMLAPPLFVAWLIIKRIMIARMGVEKWRLYLACFANCARARRRGLQR